MNIENIIEEFCERFSVQGVQPEKDGSTCIRIDDVDVVILKDPHEDMITIMAAFGAPQEGSEQIASVLLQANFLFLATAGGTIAQNPQSKNFIFMLPLRLERLDTDGFIQKLDAFLVKIDEFRKLIAEFNPGAKQDIIKSEQDAQFDMLNHIF
ncbi:MAG: type III secretion system chaperone [Succinivibrio sp.]|nr:type III secretion system chaperone [Succinivibrio sp.]